MVDGLSSEMRSKHPLWSKRCVPKFLVIFSLKFKDNNKPRQEMAVATILNGRFKP